MAWGAGGEGQLGNGKKTKSTTPVVVKGLSGVTAIAAGGEHGLALLSDGTVMSCGSNLARQLGMPSKFKVVKEDEEEFLEEEEEPENSDVPGAVQALSGVSAVSAGAEHSLALLGDGEVMAWAWVRLPNHLDLAVHPVHLELGAEIIDWFRHLAVSDDLAAHALETEPHLIAAFAAAGFREVDDPHFTHRYTHSLVNLDEPVVPAGFVVRPVRGDDDVPRRVDVHRSAFHPSRVTVDSYASVRASWPYQQGLDWIVEAPDGRFAAFCLIWWDEVNRVGELEPVGTHQDFRRLGLARAACLGAMRALRDRGATEAVVNSLGAPDNPGPRALYHSLGFADHSRTVKFVGARFRRG
jgi:ribosomal protein S18 acetylase RimI-like enzyme